MKQPNNQANFGTGRRFSISVLSIALVQLLHTFGAEAATGGIKGKVTGGGSSVVGATARILELDRAARTDAAGEFVFPNVPNGSYEVYIRAIGYAPAAESVRVADNMAELSFELRESAIEVEEIVVSASPYARPADDQYQSAESKSMVELHQSPGSSFAEKISDLPGVAVRSMGSAPTRPVLRGLSDNRVLILENGLRTGDISTFDPAHAVPIEDAGISQIDVVRGPASILFGPTAIGGLVNIITNAIPTASTALFSGTVSLSGNSASDEYKGYFNGVYSSGGHAFGISGGGHHSQDIRIPQGAYVDPGSGAVFDLERLPQSFNHTSEAGIGYSYQSDFGMIGIGGKHYEMNYGIPGVPPNPDWMNVPPTTSRIAQKKNSVEVRGLFAVDGSIIKQVRFNANYVDYNHSEYPTAQDSTGVFDFLATHFHKQEFNAALQFRHRQTGQFQGTLGFWTNVEDLALDGDEPLGPNSLTTGAAAYLFEEYLLSPATRLQAGVRFDYNHIHTNPDPSSTDSVFRTLDESRTSNALTASAGSIHRLTGELTLSLNFARSFRAPTVQELFADGIDAPSGTYTIGSPNLSPEAGFGIDASVKGNFATIVFEVSPYLNFINNYVYGFLDGDSILAFPVRRFAATDARLMGFEASVMMQPASNFALKASVDGVQADDTKNNSPLPFTPPMRALLRGSYQDSRYLGMAELRLAASQTRLGEGDTQTEGYGIVNLGAGVRFAQESLVHTVGVHCDNVFDRVYRDHLSVIKDFVPQPGRGIRLTYELAY